MPRRCPAPAIGNPARRDRHRSSDAGPLPSIDQRSEQHFCLQSALDALAAEDLKPLFGPRLLDRLAPLLQAQNRIAAEVARTVRERELIGAAESDGLKTMQSWLRGHAHLADSEAARLAGAGRALEQLPAVAAGFADGAITAGQVG
ncbi:MAG TPA: hypothetical protein VGO95_00385, partial [Modestobacter sp.]|nr:hypothetical protein [Modestobacter sp.]